MQVVEIASEVQFPVNIDDVAPGSAGRANFESVRPRFDTSSSGISVC